ncbi:MAG TPA: hypothetical protein PLU36_00445 [Chitinophagaceae bacterium]|nr:hypothetical protein [Chitinophagaceae bacterium]HNE93304.1 hypothetical protein [Chitinophagaceae bacterium]HNJ58010.1 hypothetical protein [Chitinophagaceae bacterium]
MYIIYSRVPDYFDGETAPATIHWLKDSTTNTTIPKAVFIHGKTKYEVDARYVLRSLPENKKLTVIYLVKKPQNAVVYSWWGYWITWGELLTSILLLVALFQVAVAITKNPTPEAVMEQLEYFNAAKKRKYD